MEREEYDRKFRREPIDILQEFSEDLQTESVTVDGTTVAPLRVRPIASSPSERYNKGMQQLQEKVEILGYGPDGRLRVRRTGGADYAGNEAWARFMRRTGRLK
jgi:hypothetical protein